MVARGPATIPLLLVSILTFTAYTGCLDDDIAVGRTDPGPFVDPMAFKEGHDHADHAQHQGLSWNMTELGFTTIDADMEVAWGELDVNADGLAVVAFAWPSAGLATVDVTDPTDPKPLDVIDLGYGYGADVKWIPGTEYAVLAIQAHSARGLPNPVPDPLAATVESGLMLFHITAGGEIHDIGAFTPTPDRGIHMVYPQTVDGTHYVWGAYNGKGVGLWQYSEDAKRLVPANFVPNVLAVPLATTIANQGLTGAHDMTVMYDDRLETTLMFVAHGYEGLQVYDVSNPTSPLLVAKFRGAWDDRDQQWYAHTVQAELLDDGTRRIVVVPEVFSDAETEVVAPLWVLDGTDLDDIRLVATWTNDGDHGAEKLRFSVHNLQLIDGKIALAQYHGGVWLLEVTGTWTDTVVRSAAYHVPANDPGRGKSGIYHGVYNMEDGPTVWDVVVHDGVLWATDVNSGLYAMESAAWTPGSGISSIG